MIILDESQIRFVACKVLWILNVEVKYTCLVVTLEIYGSSPTKSLGMMLWYCRRGFIELLKKLDFFMMSLLILLLKISFISLL